MLRDSRKGDGGMQIKQDLLTKNPYSRPGKPLEKVKGIVVHWTANEAKGANAKRNRDYFESLKTGDKGYASAHYIVDDEEIILCIPEDEMAYHVGAKSYRTNRFGSYPNATTIGIEMCVNADGDFKKTYEKTVELVAHLVKKYKLNVDTDVVRHYDVTGKNCPAFFVSDHYGKKVDTYAVKYGVGNNADQAWVLFKEQVKKKLQPPKPQEKPKSVAPKAQAPKQKKVQIVADQLNIRKDANLEATIVSTTKKGQVYTVLSEKNGMYKIGEGKWISANAKYVKLI